MARTYRCAEFEVDVPVAWQQQVLHLVHQQGSGDLQLHVAEAPTAHHPVPDHEKYDEASNHVAEYALAKAMAEAEFVKARALCEDARKLGDGIVEHRGALGHRIDYQQSVAGGPPLHFREVHIVRGRLYLKAQSVLPLARYREAEAALDPLFASLTVRPDPVAAARWVDPAWGIDDQSDLVSEVPKFRVDRKALPPVFHPKEGGPGGERGPGVDPGLTRKRLEYILGYVPGSSRGAPEGPAEPGEEKAPPPKGPEGDVRRRLDKFLRHSLRPGTSQPDDE